MHPLDLFTGRHGRADGPIDLDHFMSITGPDIAFKRLYFMLDNETELHNHHTGVEIDRLWKAVYRGCIAYGVPIPDNQRGHAAILGVVTP